MRKTLIALLILTAPALACPAERFVEAAERGDLPAMRRICVPVDVRFDGDTALTEAAEEGHLGVVRWLLDQGARPNLGDEEGETALHEAAEEGHLEVVTLLLDRGANLDQSDLEGRTPLMLAAGEGHADVVALLLQRGANVGALDNRARSALDYARDATIQQLLKRRGG